MGKYMTTTEASEKWDISPRRINVLCKSERIPGAIRRISNGLFLSMP